MKLLVTGGLGFLGSNMSEAAHRTGYEVTIFDNYSRTGNLENEIWLRKNGIRNFVHGDIRNSNDVSRIVKKIEPDIIFHLAGQVAMTSSIEDFRKDFETNTVGSFNLIEAVRNYSPGSFIVYSSTNKVYGDLNWIELVEEEKRYTSRTFQNGLPENIQLEFHSPYGCSKGAADQMFLDAFRIFGIRTVVFRHSSMYGPRQFSTFDQGWIGWFVKQAREVKDKKIGLIEIAGNGKQVRDVLYSEDMVRLYLDIIKKSDKVVGQAFNIGGGIKNSLSILELIDLLSTLLDLDPIRIQSNPARISDQKFFVADTTKINESTGWAPDISPEFGVREMISWQNSI